MEAASLPFPTLRDRRRDRRVRRLLSDAERFERAAERLDPGAWQAAHLRRQAAQLRELAVVEQSA